MKHTTETNYLTAPLPVVEEKAPDWWTEENIYIWEKRQRLTFIKRVKTGKNARGLYLCECGKTHEARIKHVTSGRIRSCGCGQHRRSIEWKRMVNKKRCKHYRERLKQRNGSLRSNGIGQHPTQTAGSNN